MPSLNITFTDEELAAIRVAAAGDDVSLRAFAHRAVIAVASAHKRRVAEAARLVAAAVARPRATVYGVDAYAENFTKAAALLQSLARNPPFVDGNKRTGWAAAWTFLHINGMELDDFNVDDAETFINDVATNADELGYIAEKLATYAADR